MELSKHNIFGKLKDSENYFIVNPLTKQADILSTEKANELKTGNYTDIEEYKEKGYLTDPAEEKKLYTREYLDFIDTRDSDEIQIFYVPTYFCNFACTYCYQEGYEHTTEMEQPEVIDAFFSYIDREFAGRKKYITVFGGEPLLPGKSPKANIMHLVREAEKRSLGLAFVTNGYALKSYIPILKQGFVREIQVTLDGPEEIHNKRRMLKGGNGTFNQAVEGIDAALEAGMPINLRVVVDRENMPYLGELADFAIEKGWTANPLFKTQLGRNYELHFCQSDQSKLYDRVSLYEDVYTLIKNQPQFLEFHRPAFSIAKFIFENSSLPNPLFDSCPACKTEWVFDFTGRIYSCTATVGKDDESLGTFYPAVTRKDEIIEQWEERDVTTIPECAGCSLQLACGGGCGSVAKNATGRIQSPDCRPVHEMMSMGLSLYFEQQEQEK
ncbi:MAG: radical SAM protein [Spirochaetales bacterium]|nr:radical SAM protein [Spirochaetales bacterium]